MFLQKRDKDNQIIFTDIESDSYDPNDAKNGYINYVKGANIARKDFEIIVDDKVAEMKDMWRGNRRKN